MILSGKQIKAELGKGLMPSPFYESSKTFEKEVHEKWRQNDQGRSC